MRGPERLARTSDGQRNSGTGRGAMTRPGGGQWRSYAQRRRSSIVHTESRAPHDGWSQGKAPDRDRCYDDGPPGNAAVGGHKLSDPTPSRSLKLPGAGDDPHGSPEAGAWGASWGASCGPPGYIVAYRANHSEWSKPTTIRAERRLEVRRPRTAGRRSVTAESLRPRPECPEAPGPSSHPAQPRSQQAAKWGPLRGSVSPPFRGASGGPRPR